MLNICKFYPSRLLRVSAGVVNGADLKSAGLWPQRFESSLIRHFCTFIGASIITSILPWHYGMIGFDLNYLLILEIEREVLGFTALHSVVSRSSTILFDVLHDLSGRRRNAIQGKVLVEFRSVLEKIQWFGRISEVWWCTLSHLPSCSFRRTPKWKHLTHPAQSVSSLEKGCMFNTGTFCRSLSGVSAAFDSVA